MSKVCLNIPGNAAEAAAFYAKAFGAEPPALMTYSQMPPGTGDIPAGMGPLIMHGNVKTFAGDIMLADNASLENEGTNTASAGCSWTRRRRRAEPG